MKWRWRRRIKVAPGVTVNLSTTSAGVTLGGPAGRISANTSGRVTAGQSLPGTGLYSQMTLATGKKQQKQQQKQPAPPGMAAPPAKRRGCLFFAGWGVALLLGLFGCAVVANLAGGDRPAAETPERSNGVALPTEERTALPTWTNTPEPATATAVPPTATLAPATATPEPAAAPPAAVGAVAVDNANLRSGPGTDYAVIGGAVAGDQLTTVGRNEAGDWLQLASGAWIAAALVDGAPGGLPVVAASAGAAGPICGCTEDLYKCADFATQGDAQACFNYCIAQGAGDIHRLDQDNNQIVCER